MEETYFCHICSRSGSPSHNKMIFCDSCDTPYHQHCHVPPVEDSTFTTNNKWFCSTCKPPIVETVNQRMIGQGLTVSQVASSRQTSVADIVETSIIALHVETAVGGAGHRNIPNGSKFASIPDRRRCSRSIRSPSSARYPKTTATATRHGYQ